MTSFQSLNKIWTPNELRQESRVGLFNTQTSGYCAGYAQANLVILPKEYAFDFLLFCQRNPKPCPLLEVLEAGSYIFNQAHGESIDIRTDLPKYRVWVNGELKEEVTDLTNIWEGELVTFIIGCSFSFEDAMIRSNIPVRHIDDGKNLTVPMYNTNIPCKSAGQFQGNMVVSMRPLSPIDAIRATEITSRYPRVHGSPMHIGLPESIGIIDINKPDFGNPVEIKDGELPVFWACGVTPQAIVMTSKPSFCITHAPGHMLVLDTKNDCLALSY